MKRILTMIVIAMMVCFSGSVVLADETSQSTESTQIVTNAGLSSSSSALVQKVDNMADSLHQTAMKLGVPFAIIVLIIGVALGVFFESARKMALFVILALMIIYWAPLLVGLVVTWIS